jgi:hypothetical protein
MTVLINIPKEFNATQREAIGLEIVNFIVDRTEKGLDINGNAFAGYTSSYKETLEYKIGHGSDSTVNLRLSGEMLGNISILGHGVGFIKIGFDDSESAKKAKWIQTPTGQKAGRQAPRKFLGITEKDLNRILERYKDSSTAFNTNATKSLAQDLVRRILGF